MKTLVIYYSHYGNTAFAIYYLLRILEKMGTANIQRLEYSRGQRNPVLRLIYKIMPSLVSLKPIECDLKEYDTLCLGIPVIAGRPSSIISKYTGTCSNIDNKNIICCYVYGFEANAKRCAKYTRKLLKKKSNVNIIEIFIPWNLAHNDKELGKIIAKSLSKLTAIR